MKNKKPIIYYFADLMGDINEEIEHLKLKVKNLIDIDMEIKQMESPKFDKKYDILFFDWGGMSMGNSLLESFCRELFKRAELYPGRIFIMTSSFTAYAMEDAIFHMGDSGVRPNNIYLDVDSAKNAIKSFYT